MRVPAFAFVGDFDCCNAACDAGFPQTTVSKFAEVSAQFSNERNASISDVGNCESEKERPLHVAGGVGKFEASSSRDRSDAHRAPLLFALCLGEMTVAAVGANEIERLSAF